jgi:EpsI family protein
MRGDLKRYLTVFLVLLITSGFVFVDDRASKSAPQDRIVEIPPIVGEWRGRDMPVEERIERILNTNQLLFRDYINGRGKHIFLSVVYYVDNKIGFHSPESCNTGAGSYVVKRDVLDLPLEKSLSNSEVFPVNRLVMRGTKTDKIILYFYVVGNYLTGDYLKFRLHLLKERMAFQRPGCAQIQLHSDVELGTDSTTAIMANFLKELVPYLQARSND